MIYGKNIYLYLLCIYSSLHGHLIDLHFFFCKPGSYYCGHPMSHPSFEAFLKFARQDKHMERNENQESAKLS